MLEYSCRSAAGRSTSRERQPGTVNVPPVVSTTSSRTRPVGVVFVTRTAVTRPRFCAATPTTAGSVCARIAFNAAPSHSSRHRYRGEMLQ